MLKRLSMATAITVAVAGSTARAEEETFVTFRSLTPELALELTRAAFKSCRDTGYQVGVAVVDRFGVVQVFMRDRFAGPHTVDTAIGKAWTAVSFRTDTTEMADLTQAGMPQSGVRHVPNALMIGGGVLIESQGEIVGGIGVSGAPGGDADEKCALDGIEAIVDKLEPL